MIDKLDIQGGERCAVFVCSTRLCRVASCVCCPVLVIIQARLGVGIKRICDDNAYFEHGTPRIPAKHWMETANEEAEDAFLAAEQDAWNKHLDDLNL